MLSYGTAASLSELLTYVPMNEIELTVNLDAKARRQVNYHSYDVRVSISKAMHHLQPKSIKQNHHYRRVSGNAVVLCRIVGKR